MSPYVSWESPLSSRHWDLFFVGERGTRRACLFMDGGAALQGTEVILPRPTASGSTQSSAG